MASTLEASLTRRIAGITTRILVASVLMFTLACANVPSASAEATIQEGRLAASGPLVYDPKTNLTWQRCALGQRWSPSGERCDGEPARITFDEAKTLESKGWRVPTLDELMSIVMKDRMPTIDSQAFPDTFPVYFWATDNRDRSSAWYVLFENGRSNHYFPPRTNRDAVRFVRTGPWTKDAGPRPPGHSRKP